MPEQSIGMTTGTGDGTVGGYINTRMTAKDQKTIGNGILSSVPTVTGTGTSTLTVGVCDILTAGYFYQNTSALTISVSGVSPGIYMLVCRVNDTSSAATVIRSASGTTIPLRSVRLCLVDNLNSATDVSISLITVSGGNVESIAFVTNTFAVSTTVSKSDIASATKSTVQTITAANTATVITWDTITLGSSGVFYSLSANSIWFTTGAYLINGYIEYPVTATGSREISIIDNNYCSNLLSSIASVPNTDNIRQYYNFVISTVTTKTLQIRVTSSVAGETVTAGTLFVARL